MSKSNPASLQEALARIRALLEQNRPMDAIELIRKTGMSNAELRNAYGVCLMRAGELDKALEVYRGLCISDGVSLKSKAPVVHLVNYATALLLKRNVPGCLSVLRHIPNSSRPAAARLLSAIDRWRRSHTWFQRLKSALSDRVPATSIELDFPPGELPDENGP